MPSYEALQSLAKTRYGQDVPGALKRALENNTPGITSNVTGINGLAVLAHNMLSDPDITSGEWHSSAVFDATNFWLTFGVAP